MFEILRTRIQQKYRTLSYPDGPVPTLSDRFQGRPSLPIEACPQDCQVCVTVCPTQAITVTGEQGQGCMDIDLGRCLFCRACVQVCPTGALQFSGDHQLAASDRQSLQIGCSTDPCSVADDRIIRRLFGRSLRLRQVSAGGCNACEADANVLTTLAWDLGRFGIDFVASPRHADGLLVTGPVTENMREALLKTYDAVPDPKVVIAAGTCAISGGIFAGHPEVHNGVDGLLPVDLYVPGCPYHPLTLLDGLLRLIGKLEASRCVT